MLARKNLIPLRKEFGRIRKEAKNYNSDSFGLLISYGAATPQCAFIVSKKVDRSSVVRHAVKRKLSDAIFPFLPRLPKNLELVFLAKQKAITISKDDLFKEVQAVLSRARLVGA